MSSEVFRRVGRGGAGNWYNQKDVEEADRLEDGQKPGGPAQASPIPTAPYAHGGRGGAGNFFEAQSVAATAAERRDEAGRVQAVASRSKPSAYSGRGGAGNWAGASAAVAAAAAEQEAAEAQRQRQAKIEAQIRQDVEAGLAMPAPAYHGAPEREGKKKPEPDA